MAQAAVKLPPGFELESDTTSTSNLPPGFELEEHQSKGASGSFDQPKPDIAQRFQTEHPYLSSPLTALARFGKGAVDMVTGTVDQVKNAVMTPATPAEKDLIPSVRVAKRLVVDPMLEESRKSREANTGLEAFGHGLASKLPVIGPGIASMTEQATSGHLPEVLGGMALSIIAPELAKEYIPGFQGGVPKTSLIKPGEKSISAMSTMIESGVKNDVVNAVAEKAIPIFQQATAELGKTPSQFPEGAATVKVPGAKRAGITTEAGRRALRTGGEHAIEIANHAVDITDRPFKEVLRDYGNATIERPGVPAHLTVKGRVLSNLDNAMSENANNPALVRAIRDLRSRVEAQTNFNGLQDLKVLANKKSSVLFDRSLGAQINASADAAYSWKILGDSIRAEMYPELSSLSGVDLSEAGRLEGIVMDARDGIRQHFYKDVLNPHNKRMQQNYWEYLRDGSMSQRSMIKRALMLEPTPAGTFNARFRDVMGGNQFPSMPSSVPVYPKGSPSVFAPETLTGKPQVVNELFPHHIPPETLPPAPPTGPRLPGAPETLAGEQQPLMAIPPGVSRELAESIFKVQQAADRAARAAPPETIRGTQSQFGESSTPQKAPVAEPGRPGEFFPGKRGRVKVRDVEGKPVLDEKGKPKFHDYTEQGQLYSIRQTPPPPVRFNPMERLTYTMKDLREMAQEIADFVQQYPNHPEVSSLMKDIEFIKHELYRMVEAHRTPGVKDKPQ